MEFSWDEGNVRHIALHDVSTAEAEQVIQNDPLDLEVQTRNSERRILQVGQTDEGRILLVVAVERGAKIRVVTAFPASRAHRRFYLARKGANDATNRNS